MPYSEKNGVRTYYEVTGEGMPFVMLHANPCDHWMWSYQIANFSRRFRVIAPDMRGYGRTDKPVERYPFDALVDDIAGILEQEGVTEGILAGASMGSKIAFKLAADRPGFFRRYRSRPVSVHGDPAGHTPPVGQGDRNPVSFVRRRRSGGAGSGHHRAGIDRQRGL